MPFSLTPVHVAGLASLIGGALVTFVLSAPLARRLGRGDLALKGVGLALVAAGAVLILAL